MNTPSLKGEKGEEKGGEGGWEKEDQLSLRYNSNGYRGWDGKGKYPEAPPAPFDLYIARNAHNKRTANVI